MTLDVERIEADARAQTGLDDTGGDHYREGLERLVDSMNTQSDSTALGEVMQLARLTSLPAARLGVEETYRLHPDIDDQVVGGRVFVIGLPRTGTTALSQLVAADPQFCSLRTWESGSPVPPPEKETEHTDPRIAVTDAAEPGAEELDRWALTVDRAMGFRDRMGDDRFADVSFADLESDPVGALGGALDRIGLDFPDSSRTAVAHWAVTDEPGSHGTHTYSLEEFSLVPDRIRERFATYCARFGVEA